MDVKFHPWHYEYKSIMSQPSHDLKTPKESTKRLKIAQDRIPLFLWHSTRSPTSSKWAKAPWINFSNHLAKKFPFLHRPHIRRADHLMPGQSMIYPWYVSSTFTGNQTYTLFGISEAKYEVILSMYLMHICIYPRLVVQWLIVILDLRIRF